LDSHGVAADLVDELGIEPSTALRELEQAILRQDPALDAPDRAAPEPAGGSDPLSSTVTST
jgi:DNA-binding SARP family transcriptional activator